MIHSNFGYRKHCFKMASGGECADWMCDREDAAMKKCSHCKSTHYCSRKCQQENWRIHKLTWLAIQHCRYWGQYIWWDTGH